MNPLRYLGSLFTRPTANSANEAAQNRFSAASDSFGTAYAASETYTTRANHRYTILAAASASHSGDACSKAIDEYTDHAGSTPYTEVYLAAHTAAINDLAAAFDALEAAFTALSSTDSVYGSAAALYEANSARYVFATDAYSLAAHCAMATALDGKVQAAKNAFEVLLLEERARSASPMDVEDARSRASTFKANAANDAATADRLEQAATKAEARARDLCAEAGVAALIAKVTLEAI